MNNKKILKDLLNHLDETKWIYAFECEDNHYYINKINNIYKDIFNINNINSFRINSNLSEITVKSSNFELKNKAYKEAEEIIKWRLPLWVDWYLSWWNHCHIFFKNINHIFSDIIDLNNLLLILKATPFWMKLINWKLVSRYLNRRSCMNNRFNETWEIHIVSWKLLYYRRSSFDSLEFRLNSSLNPWILLYYIEAIYQSKIWTIYKYKLSKKDSTYISIWSNLNGSSYTWNDFYFDSYSQWIDISNKEIQKNFRKMIKNIQNKSEIYKEYFWKQFYDDSLEFLTSYLYVENK